MKRLTATLMVTLLAACASTSAPLVGDSALMVKSRIADEDSISPVRITHHSEQIWTGNSLEQDYNYLLYEFETEQHAYRARAYLDEVDTVAVFGPFEKDSRRSAPLQGVEVDQRVLGYLGRRYAKITRLGAEGYVPVD